MKKLFFFFGATGEPPNVKPNIEFTYDPKEPRVQKVLEKLLNTSSNHITIERPKLEFKRSHNNKDFFSLSMADTEEAPVLLQTPAVMTRRNSTVALVKELLNLTIAEKDKGKTKCEEDLEEEEELEEEEKPVEIVETLNITKEKPVRQLKTLVIELEQDDEFFKMLMEELNQAASLQDQTASKFKQDISALETRMSKVAAPTQKVDMYNWRKIFAIYMDAQIFQGQAESDRTFRSVERAKKQMQWFLTQLAQSNLLIKLKTKESKAAFESFMALNTELITMKHYQMLNQTAMRKILKKHDKRSGLNASQSFPEFVPTEHLFSPKLATLLYATITTRLTTIIPQPEDYGKLRIVLIITKWLMFYYYYYYY
jgi:E3 ubiquitin-protein ligase BAH